MITVDTAIKLAAIVGKMGIKVSDLRVPDSGNAQKDRETVGLLILDSVLSGAYKAADEIIDFIAAYKNVTADEAKKLDFIATFKELLADAGVVNFFK